MQGMSGDLYHKKDRFKKIKMHNNHLKEVSINVEYNHEHKTNVYFIT